MGLPPPEMGGWSAQWLVHEDSCGEVEQHGAIAQGAVLPRRHGAFSRFLWRVRRVLCVKIARDIPENHGKIAGEIAGENHIGIG